MPSIACLSGLSESVSLFTSALSSCCTLLLCMQAWQISSCPCKQLHSCGHGPQSHMLHLLQGHSGRVHLQPQAAQARLLPAAVQHRVLLPSM